MPEVDCTARFSEIKGIPGYVITTNGEVWSCVIRGKRLTIGDHWRLLKPGTNSAGYCHVTLRPAGIRYVHRLVLESFVSPCPQGMQACHNDGNRTNNILSNLRWDTPKANTGDRYGHGTMPQGSEVWNARLNEKTVAALLADWRTGEFTQVGLGKKYGIRQNHVSLIVRGELWKHVFAAHGVDPQVTPSAPAPEPCRT